MIVSIQDWILKYPEWESDDLMSCRRGVARDQRILGVLRSTGCESVISLPRIAAPAWTSVHSSNEQYPSSAPRGATDRLPSHRENEMENHNSAIIPE